MLAKQVLYHFSHIYSPFCSGYFGCSGIDMKEIVCLVKLGGIYYPVL
jgi:hypothetical protein